MLLIQSMSLGPLQANCYLLGCEQTRQAVVIDPGGETNRILEALNRNNLKLIAIINTHGHFDHVSANKSLQAATGADLMIHTQEAPMLAHISQAAESWGMQSEDSPQPDRLLEDGDIIECGNISLSVLHTPGHSPGGICLLADKAVFVGDTLFAGSIGRTDLSGGDFNTLITSVRNKLFNLPDDVEVYPGHMGQTTIGREKQTNPFFQMD